MLNCTGNRTMLHWESCPKCDSWCTGVGVALHCTVHMAFFEGNCTHKPQSCLTWLSPTMQPYYDGKALEH